jgi:hypothetical protein
MIDTKESDACHDNILICVEYVCLFSVGAKNGLFLLRIQWPACFAKVQAIR